MCALALFAGAAHAGIVLQDGDTPDTLSEIRVNLPGHPSYDATLPPEIYQALRPQIIGGVVDPTNPYRDVTNLSWYFRVGNNPEAPITSLNLDASFGTGGVMLDDPNGSGLNNRLRYRYVDPGGKFQIEVEHELIGGPHLDAFKTEINTRVTVDNLSNKQLDFHLFKYEDATLTKGFDEDAGGLLNEAKFPDWARVIPVPSNQKKRLAIVEAVDLDNGYNPTDPPPPDGTGTLNSILRSVVYGIDPDSHKLLAPDHVEIGFVGTANDILSRLNDGSATTLNDAPTGAFFRSADDPVNDLALAFQWDNKIHKGRQFVVVESTFIVPEPTTSSLLLGMLLLGAGARRRQPATTHPGAAATGVHR